MAYLQSPHKMRRCASVLWEQSQEDWVSFGDSGRVLAAILCSHSFGIHRIEGDSGTGTLDLSTIEPSFPRPKLTCFEIATRQDKALFGPCIFLIRGSKNAGISGSLRIHLRTFSSSRRSMGTRCEMREILNFPIDIFTATTLHMP